MRRRTAEQVLYAHAGIGAASQLCGMLLMQALDTQFTTVPYKGTGPAMTDLMGGQVDLMCDQTTNTTNPIKAGSIKAYAVFTEERLDALPDVPTAAEAGLEGIEIAIWHGLYAPAGTPEEVVAKLSAALKTALADANVVQRFAELGTAPVPPEAATPDALQEKLARRDRPLEAGHRGRRRVRGVVAVARMPARRHPDRPLAEAWRSPVR